jgi:hypothetical protein
MSRRHPREGRRAETYKRVNGRLVWTGYTAGPGSPDHPTGAAWSDEIQGWIVEESK